MPRTTGRIVGLTGYASAGKDTAAAGLVAAGYVRRGFADPLKAMALAIDPLIQGASHIDSLSWFVKQGGWDAAKRIPDVRRFLQRLGTDAVRVHLGDDAWVRAFDCARNRSVDTVAPDVRFPNEAEYIRRHGGIVIRIDRPGVGPVNGHVSEDIGGIPVDATVVNNRSVDELQWQVAELVDRHYGTKLNLPF